MVALLQRCHASLVLALLVWSGSLQAADEFTILKKPIEIPERGRVMSYVLVTERGRFSFLPPPGWLAKNDPAEKSLSFTSTNLSTCIALKLFASADSQTSKLNTNQLHQLILDRYPDANVVRTFECYTSAERGFAFDLERLAQNKTRLTTRLAFVAFPEAVVEFSLTTSAKHFADQHFTFGNLLTSFQIEPTLAKE